MKAKIKKEENKHIYVGSQSDMIGFSNFIIDVYEKKLKEIGKEACEKWLDEEDEDGE